jgi:hypothetical protein
MESPDYPSELNRDFFLLGFGIERETRQYGDCADHKQRAHDFFHDDLLRYSASPCLTGEAITLTTIKSKNAAAYGLWAVCV